MAAGGPLITALFDGIDSLNTLVIAPNWIGDALMARPMLHYLKQASAASITVLAPAWVAPVLHVMPEVDRVIESGFPHGGMQLRDRLRMARRLRGFGFDRAVILPNSFKAALIPLWAGIPERIAYRGESRTLLLTRTLADPERGAPMTKRYLGLVGDDSAVVVPSRILIAPERTQKTLEHFGLQRGRSLFALCPGAEFGPSKQWPAGHYARLAELIFASDTSTQLVVLGSAADRPIADQIATLSTAPIRVLAGDTNLAEAIDLIAGSTAVVSNDSGLMHVAAALGRPQVALFGSTDPRHTPPGSSRAQIMWLHLACSPCFQRVCPLGHLNCLNHITPERVKTALETVLDS